MKFRKYDKSEIPKWCVMPLSEHFDGIGSCWGISYGYVAKFGEKHCKTCDYYNKKWQDCKQEITCYEHPSTSNS